MTNDDSWIPPYIANIAGRVGMLPDMVIGLAKAYQDLLNTPVYDNSCLAGAGVDVDIPNLIRLADRSGLLQYPVFQFNDHFHIYPIVLRVNEYLGVGRFQDHMTVWQWWTSPNSWLPANNARPCAQIGTMSDDDLFRLATTVGEAL